MPEAQEALARDALAAHYGVEHATISPIGYGLINWLARVDSGGGSYVLKRYNPAYFQRWNVELSVSAQQHCRGRGVPVPALIPNRQGQLISWAPDASYVLAERVVGRHLSRGDHSPTAAYSLGEVVGRVTLALAESWREPREPWTLRKPDETVGRFERLLAAAEKGVSELDRRTAHDAWLRLSFLRRHPDLYAQVSALSMQWVHNDFLETNLLFANDRVSGVLDFDNTTVLPRGFDFMRGLAYCIGPNSPERDHYLRGYLDTAQPSREELDTYVPLWAYKVVGDIWPLEIRYLEPETFNPRWEAACWAPFLPANWEIALQAAAVWLTTALTAY